MIGRDQHALLHHSHREGSLHSADNCPVYRTLLDARVRHVTDDLFWRGDGHSFSVEYTVTPLTEKGTVTGAVLVFRDISERKIVERALAKKSTELQRSNEELSHFSHAVSHDLKAPLRQVSGFLTLLRRSKGNVGDDAVRKLIDFAVDGTKRMAAMIEDLLDYSRVQTQPRLPEAVALEEILKAALLNLEAGLEDCNATLDIAPDLPTLQCDSQQMVRVFQNLIDNAIKYRTEERALEISIGVESGKEEWTFWVKDNGIGIGLEHQRKIFNVFQRLHGSNEYEGTGIGLAIVKRIIEGHGGRIWVESTADAGCRFAFTFPKNQPSADTGPAKPAEES